MPAKWRARRHSSPILKKLETPGHLGHELVIRAGKVCRHAPVHARDKVILRRRNPAPIHFVPVAVVSDGFVRDVIGFVDRVIMDGTSAPSAQGVIEMVLAPPQESTCTGRGSLSRSVSMMNCAPGVSLVFISGGAKYKSSMFSLPTRMTLLVVEDAIHAFVEMHSPLNQPAVRLEVTCSLLEETTSASLEPSRQASAWSCWVS